MIGSGIMPFGRRRSPPTADMLAVAKLLAERGPVYGDEALKVLGWEADRWWSAVSHRKDWFALTGKGWVLSDAGREALLDEAR
jgi:hypothetical protein